MNLKLPHAVAFDLDGTVYLHDTPLPGAVELMSFLRERQVPHLFATNNSGATAATYVRRLNAMGITASADQVVTSNQVAARHLSSQGVHHAYLVATAEVAAEYGAAGIHHDADSPQAVLLAFDTTLDYAKIVATAAFLREGLPYYATHPDLVCPMPDGPIPDCGSFAALFAAATGRTPTVLGKPSTAMADTIRDRLWSGATTGPPVTFVGDRLYTDVRMANDNGFTAVLTLTGEATRSDLAASDLTADLVVNGLGELLASFVADMAP